MPKGNTMSRLLIASLTAAAIAAPAAVAQPIDPTGPAQDTAPAAQDLRTEAAAAPSPAPSAPQDLRSEAAAAPSSAPSHPRYVQGPPTWPMHPQVISSAPAQVADVSDGDGGGIDLPVALIGVAGMLALGGGLTAVALRHRTRTAH
jgi:hypothetical protein